MLLGKPLQLIVTKSYDLLLFQLEVPRAICSPQQQNLRTLRKSWFSRAFVHFLWPLLGASEYYWVRFGEITNISCNWEDLGIGIKIPEMVHNFATGMKQTAKGLACTSLQLLCQEPGGNVGALQISEGL